MKPSTFVLGLLVIFVASAVLPEILPRGCWFDPKDLTHRCIDNAETRAEDEHFRGNVGGGALFLAGSLWIVFGIAAMENSLRDEHWPRVCGSRS